MAAAWNSDAASVLWPIPSGYRDRAEGLAGGANHGSSHAFLRRVFHGCRFLCGRLSSRAARRIFARAFILSAVTWQRRTDTPVSLSEATWRTLRRPWGPTARSAKMPSSPPSRSKVDGSGMAVAKRMIRSGGRRRRPNPGVPAYETQADLVKRRPPEKDSKLETSLGVESVYKDESANEDKP